MLYRRRQTDSQRVDGGKDAHDSRALVAAENKRLTALFFLVKVIITSRLANIF